MLLESQHTHTHIKQKLFPTTNLKKKIFPPFFKKLRNVYPHLKSGGIRILEIFNPTALQMGVYISQFKKKYGGK